MCSCGGRHHPSICDGENYGKKVEEKETKLETKVSGLQVQTKQPEEPVELKELREVNVATTVKTGGGTALQTLQAIVTANGGEQSVKCRLLLDSACNKTFITTELAELFKANPKCTEMVNVSSFGKQKGSIRSDVYDVEIKGLDHKNKIKAEVFTVPTITTLPNSKPEVVKENYEHLKDLWFPDVSEKDTLEVHMLVGMDLLWQLQTGHSRRGTTEEPVAIETIFGWTLAGKIGGSNSSEMKVNVNLFIEEGGKNGIENNVKKLWDYETLGIRETDDVYEDMVDSIRFTGERYSVKLPWKTGNYHLPDNYRMSQSRMQSQLKKLKKELEKLQAYHEIITDQLNEGIVEKVMAASSSERVHYLPHHPVIRENAETTKMRIVFDASARMRKGALSLNDCLHIGPSLAPLLYDVLLRLREHQVILIGDIRKAFLQIEVDEGDRDSLRFLWVKDPFAADVQEEILRFSRVIFGVGPSPFLLGGTLAHHLEKYEKGEPEIVKAIKNGLYVDDLASGGKTAEFVWKLYLRVKTILQEGGFIMHKWKTNDVKLRKMIEGSEAPVDDQEPTFAQTQLGKVNQKDEKILGLIWNENTDSFQFNLEDIADKGEKLEVTKRNILSILSSLFDPLGIIGPVLVAAKVLFQKMCLETNEWDKVVSEDLVRNWKTWLQDLKQQGSIVFSRSIYMNIQEEVTWCWIHGFGDASKVAYCAVIYIVYTQLSGTYAKMLTSKPRVAPMKPQSIPRLGLMAARCTAKLVQNVETALNNQRRIEGRTLWSDSKTVLCWLRNKKEWKQFVKHRVNDILKVSDNEHWKYCPSEDNPADIGTRGMIASKLNESQLWWNGPSWLVKEESFWPKQEPISDTEETEEERATSMVALDITDEDGLGSIMDVTRYGTLWKLFRITAWVVRFIWNIRAKLRGKQKISDEFLHTEETEAARKMWLISAQEDLKKEKHFPELEKRLGIKENDGILRCYGRLDHAVLGEEAKHPVILPKHHPVTRLIVDSCHRHVLHGRTRNTLAEFRSQYWMGKARQVIKAILRRCATCKRHQARPFNKPAPGQLPEFRVTPARPFQNCGVDFAGPLYVLRRKSMKKVYITLFTYGVTRAIHLELVPDLSAETFKQTLKKFTARRGTPSLMVSDNAKTFEATAKWLKKLYRDPTVQHFLQENNIRWRFNLSLAPWWGGFFERLVGLVKRTLRKVLGNARLRFEELETILIETEGMLNNRPLTYLYEEATEDVLTPNHLIFGHRLGTLPDAEVDSADEDTDEGKCMKYIRTRQQHLWNRWEKEYLTNLREHHEMGTSGSSKPEIGEVVLIKEEQTNRRKWKLGRIVSLIEGRDGMMRGATIRVISGGNPREIQRPIQKLYSMELKCQPDEAMPAERQLPVQPDEETRNVRPRRLAAMDGEIR